MKKLFALLLCVTFAFASCGSDDDDTITLKDREVTLKSGDTYQITAESSNSISYTCDNEYYATVSSSGLVTAKRVGETEIKLSDGSSNVNLRVIVNPKSNLYPEPNVEFGISKTDLIRKIGAPTSETTGAIGYSDYSPNAPIAMYMFDTNDRLTSSMVLVKTAYSSELGSFLSERYVYGTKINEEYTYILINALKLDDATMMVGAGLYNTQYWMTSYMPYSSKTRSTDIDIDTRVKALLNEID